MTGRAHSDPPTLLPPWASTAGWLIGIFILLVGLKSYWVFHSTGPGIFGDEVLYKEFARHIAHGQPYGRDAHYPPLYPLVLSLALLSKDHWYEWMLFINALLSSSMIFPVYLIGKRVLSGRTVWVPVILAALLPFHAVYPALLMSENLFLVLFLMAVYVSLIRDERDWLAGALVGAVCALAYMTKYLFLPSIPFLIGLWWLTPLLNGDLKGASLRQKLQLPAVAAATTGFLVVYAPWPLYAHYSGLSIVRDALGLTSAGEYRAGLATADLHFSGARTGGPNLDSLVLWGTAYTAYMVLALAPALGVLGVYARVVSTGKAESPFREKLVGGALIGLSVGYWLLALQHSWGSESNYPEPGSLLGRYLMHLTPLYLVAFGVALVRTRRQLGSMSPVVLAGSPLCALALVYVARRVLYAQAVWRLPEWFAGSEFNSPDSFVYRRPLAMWAALMVIAAIGIGLIAGRAHKVLAMRHLLPFAAGCLIVFQLAAFVLICKKTMVQGGWQLHGRLLAPVFRADFDRGVESIALTYDIPGLRDGRLLWSLYFWLEQGTDAKITVRAMTERAGAMPAAAKAYLLSRVESGEGPVYAYTVDGTRYYLHSVPERPSR